MNKWGMVFASMATILLSQAANSGSKTMAPVGF